MSFAFSTVEPNVRGYLDKPQIPLSRFLGAAWDQGVHYSMGASIYRISEQLQLQADLSLWGLLDQQAGRTLSPDEASAQYGTTRLRFTEPVKEGVARLLRERHDEYERRSYLLSEGASSKKRIAASFGVGMLGSLTNPVDFALMFFPVVGSEATATKLGALGAGSFRRALARGLVTEESIAHVMAPKVLAAAISGVVYQAVAEIPVYISNRMDQTPYTLADSITNIALGGAFAAGFRLALSGAGRLLKKLSLETHEAVVKKASNDFLAGKDIEVHKLVELDEAVIRERVVQDFEIEARAEAIKAIDTYAKTELRNTVLDDLGLSTDTPRVDQPNLIKIAEDWLPIFEQQGKDVTILRKLFSTVRDGAPTLIDLNNLARHLGMVFDPMERKFPSQFYIAPDPERARLQRIAGVRDEDLRRPGQVTNEQRRQQAAQLEAERNLEIERRVAIERERAIKDYVENLRRQFDPELETRRRLNEETLRQQNEGKVLTDEQVAKYGASDVVDDTDLTVIERDIADLRESLDVPETRVDPEAAAPTAVDHIVATLEKLKMGVGDGKTPRMHSGIPPEIWNSLIDLVIAGVRAGERLYSVVESALRGRPKALADKIRAKLYDSTSELRPAAMLSPDELRAEAKPAIIASVSEKGITARGQFHGFAYEKLNEFTGGHYDYGNNWDYMRGREGFITVNQRHVTRAEMQALVGESESFAMAVLKSSEMTGGIHAIKEKIGTLEWERRDAVALELRDYDRAQPWLTDIDMEIRALTDQVEAIERANRTRSELDVFHSSQLDLHIDVGEPVNKAAWDRFHKEAPAGYVAKGDFYVPNGKLLSDGLSERLLLERLRDCILK